MTSKKDKKNLLHSQQLNSEPKPQIYPAKSPEVMPSVERPEINTGQPGTEIQPIPLPSIEPSQPDEIVPIE